MSRMVRFVAVALVGGCLWAMPTKASAQVFVRIGPPVVRVAAPVPVPPPPYAYGYAWQPGYYAWSGVSYRWMPGVWARPPYRGAYWVPGRWAHAPRGYFWAGGYWRR